jgi:hypothetical protein
MRGIEQTSIASGYGTYMDEIHIVLRGLPRQAECTCRLIHFAVGWLRIIRVHCPRGCGRLSRQIDQPKLKLPDEEASQIS